MRRALTSFVVVLVFAGSASVAHGQSEEEVAEAARLAEAAASSRAGAHSRTVESEVLLLDAVHDYEALTTRITEASFALADVIESTRHLETEFRSARAEARRMVVAAYVAGAPGPPLLHAASVTDIAFANRVRVAVAEVRSDHFLTFDQSTASLGSERAELGARRAELAAMRDEATVLVPRLRDLVRDARTFEAFAVEQEAAAVAAYELEAAELEAALALVSPRALLWRELVATHFPEAMVWAALQVLDCESGGDPDVVNDESGSAGLFQFLEGTWVFASAGAGFDGASRFDPEANVASAAWLVARSDLLDHPRGSWGHWVCQPDAELMAFVDAG